MNRLIRFLAVIAIALSPVWGFSGQVGARPAAWPTYPGFFSTNCNGISSPNGSVSMACSTGGYVLTQVLSGYACNELDINVSAFSSGPFIATATVQSGTVNNTVTIDGTGNYYMQFPFFLQQNTIVIQFTAPQSGSMTIGGLFTTTCPVATLTPTINPSSTATNTPVPVTGTPTPIPTFTPLPSGHSTFTITPTPVPATNTNTPVATSTPLPVEDNCGTPDFPLLNCNFVGAYSQCDVSANHWTRYNICDMAWYNTPSYAVYNLATIDHRFAPYWLSSQTVHVGATGTLYVEYQLTSLTGGQWKWTLDTTNPDADTSSCHADSGTWCVLALDSVVSGTDRTFGVGILSSCDCALHAAVRLRHVWIASSPATLTPTNVPFTSTPTVAPTVPPLTATAIAGLTLTAVASSFTPTPIPIPGAMSTNIPTATECPGGCVVTQLTAIPGMATRVTVDTSPFSPFTSLSLARSTCAPFGYVAIPYPVVHGTPAYGSTTPLSVTWTIPITAPWDDTHPFSNTAIQPCAMLNEIPSTVWDFTYWFSVFAIAVVFIMWLIGFVGRLSGEETING